MPPSTAVRRPLRVPKDNPGPVPPPGPLSEEEDLIPAPAVPIPAPAEEEEEEEEGLNVGAALHAAQQARMKARKLPPLPPKITFPDWQDYWKPLSPEQKSHIALYWYRLSPKIDRQMIDKTKPKYIDCAGSDEQMSYEYMLNTHGGGVYQGLINDTDIRKNGQISQILFEIPLSQHEPIIDLEELDVNHRENQAFVNKLKARGILTSDGRVNKNPTAESRKEDIMSTAVVTRLLDAALDPKRNTPLPQTDTGLSNLIIEMMKQNNPNAQLATLLAVVDKLKPAEVPKADSALEYLKLMEAQRTNFEARIAELQAKIFELATKPAPVAEKPDTLAEIEKIKTLAETLGMGTGGGKTSWVDRLIETVGPAIPGVINIISNRLNTQQPQGNPGIPRMPNDLENPIGQLPAPATPGQPQPTGEEMFNFLDQVILNAGNEFLTAIANGTPGYTAADAVITLRGMPTYQMIIKDGEQGLIDAIKRNPAFAQQLAKITTEERLAKWIHEFVHADEYDEGDEGDDAPLPSPVKEKKGKAN